MGGKALSLHSVFKSRYLVNDKAVLEFYMVAIYSIELLTQCVVLAIKAMRSDQRFLVTRGQRAIATRYSIYLPISNLNKSSESRFPK